MAAEYIRAARKANAFARLGELRLAVADALGIENGEAPQFAGAIKRDPELLQIAQIESVNEFLQEVQKLVKENTVEGETDAEKNLGEITNVLKAFATGDETPLETLYNLSKSREDFKTQIGDLTEQVTKAAENYSKVAEQAEIASKNYAETTTKIAELEAKNVELEAKLVKKAK